MCLLVYAMDGGLSGGITVISDSVIISISLTAIGNVRTVVILILMTVSITVNC